MRSKDVQVGTLKFWPWKLLSYFEKTALHFENVREISVFQSFDLFDFTSFPHALNTEVQEQNEKLSAFWFFTLQIYVLRHINKPFIQVEKNISLANI